jgi:hypothetical protein
MFRTPNVTMDNRAGTSVIVRILQEPQDVLRVTLQTAPALRVTASSSTTGEKGRQVFWRPPATQRPERLADLYETRTRSWAISGPLITAKYGHSRCLPSTLRPPKSRKYAP